MAASKILVRMPNWLGDAVMATALFPKLRAHFPQAHITALISQALAPVIENNPHIDEKITFSRDKKNRRKEAQHLREVLIAKTFDTGILLTGSFSSAWDFFRSRIPRRIGYPTHLRRLLLTDAVAAVDSDHQVKAYCRLLSPFGIPLESAQPELFVSQTESNAAQEKFIQSQQPFIGINPGAAYGSAKCWPPERFISLTQKLLDHFALPVVFFGDASTKSLVDGISSKFQNGVINLAGKTSLRELLALFSIAELIISNDSGPMHVRAAFDGKLIALFGSTNSIKTGPYMEKGLKIIHKSVFCSPCCLRACPIDFRCMNAISCDDVFAATKHLLSKAF